MMMANLPTSPVIIQEDPNVAGPGSGMEGGASDSAIGICTDVPNPKESDWARIVIGGTVNPIGKPTSFQSLVEYSIDTFDASPIGFAPADTQAAPGEIYVTNAGGSGWDLTNKTVEYTTEVGDWLWGAVEGTPQPACKVYECDAYVSGLSGIVSAGWALDEPTGNNIAENFVDPGEFLGTWGTPLGNALTSTLDECIGYSGDGANIGANVGLRSNQDGANAGYVTSIDGAVGIDIRGDTANSIRMIDIRLNAATVVSLTKNTGATIVFQISTNGDNIFVDTGVNFTGGANIILTWTLTSLGVWTAEVYKDFILGWSSSGDTSATGISISSPYFYVGSTGGNGSVLCRYVWYISSHIDSSVVDTMGQFWAQNKIGYIDPNPNCIPP
jgi:hypothetical protein